MRWRQAWLLVPVGILGAASWAVVSRARALPGVALLTPPRFWGGLAASEASAFGRTVAPALFLAAVVVAIAAVIGRRSRASRGLAAVALVGGAFAAVAWYEGALYGAFVLEQVADVDRAVQLAHTRPAVHLLATAVILCALPALLWRRSVAAWVLGAGIAVTVGCAAWATKAVFAVGPDPALNGLAHLVPVHRPVQAQRVPGGCVLTRNGSGWDGLSLVRPLPIPVKGCPAPLVPGSFVLGQAPLFAVPDDTPSEALAGWSSESHGDVRILVRLVDASPHHLEAWTLSEVRVGVRQPPVEGDASTRPLPGAVLLHRGETWDGVGPMRVELLVLPEAAPTVGELLAVCDAATRVHPRGLICTLAAGEGWEAWAAASSG